jgi:hypothetical protein
MRRALVLALALACGCPPSPPTKGGGVAPPTSATPTGGPVRWAEVATDYERALEAAIALAATDRPAAVKAIDDAYFTIYEGQAKNLEVATRLNIGMKQVGLRENGYQELKQAVRLGAPDAAIQKRLRELVDGVRADAAKLDELKVEAPK